MVKLRALVPDATVNYIKNPSMRYDTTDWNVQGSTISRVLTRARFGIASLEVVSSGSALHEGAYSRVSSLSGVSENITVSIYVRGEGRVRIRLDNNVVGGTEFYSQPVQLTDERWTRIHVSGFSSGGNDLRLFVETDEDVPVIRTFYLDGAQLERKSYPTTFCDGDQDGCRWNGLYHASTSQRGDDTRAGGKWIELSGPEREAEDLYMTVAGGLGVAPLTNNTQSFALAPGGHFSNLKVNMRVMTFTFHAKHKVESEETPVSLAHLHNLRQMLIDIIKPDKTGGDEDILFEYDDGTVPLYYRARYDGGLEGEWDVRNQFVNSFPLRLLATSPFMEEDTQEAHELDFQDSIVVNNAVSKINDIWGNLNHGLNASVGSIGNNALALGLKGEIYFSGTFTTANNDAQAIDPLISVGGITYWDGEKFVRFTSGVNTPTVSVMCVAVAPNGDIIAGGNFTSIGGVAANRIARWNGTTWVALGSGLNGNCYTVAVAPNGDIYAGGAFSTAGGVTSNFISRWDGFQWRRLGQYNGLNDDVYKITISTDGNIVYVGGTFTSQFGNGGGANTLLNITEYNTATQLFYAMGNGLAINFGGDVRDIKIGGNGLVYATGYFPQYIYSPSSYEINNVAAWNGSYWDNMGGGLTESDSGDPLGTSMSIMANGNVVVSGRFLKAGGINTRYIAIWNGSAWVNIDSELPVSVQMYTLARGNDFFMIGSSNSDDQILVSAINQINNIGSAESSPVIYIQGPGYINYIKNKSTKKILYLNLRVLENEEVMIDFGKGTIQSALRGNILYTLVSGSDFRNFTLRPGPNEIICFMVDDVNAKMSIQYQPVHWSVDATQRGEEV